MANTETNTERFLFTDFVPGTHFVCVWDEFRLPSSLRTFKQAIAGETFTSDVKNKQSVKVCYRVPIIMISNTSYEDLIDDCRSEAGIAERIIPVHADSKPIEVQRKAALEAKFAKRQRK